MLSVLIPTYNYDVSPLVTAIQKEANTLKINYEIIVLEDGSNEHITTNFNCKNIKVIVLQNNVGRILARQKLAETAQFDWLLFLDADVLPKSNSFISSYLKTMQSSSNYEAIFGGVAYLQKPPQYSYSLRWFYGKKMEAVPAIIRNKTPYKVIISGNFMIKKATFLTINASIKENGYGLDIFFASKLKEQRIRVHHINNQVFHLGLEKSAVYLRKMEKAVLMLLVLHKKNEIPNSDNTLMNFFITLKTWRLIGVFSMFFKKLKPFMVKNLTSSTPYIPLLQFYRISFMCYSYKNAS